MEMRTIIILAAFLAIGSPAFCATPPVLFNKALQVSVGVTVTAKLRDTGEVRQPTGFIKQTIYVSNIGRVFVRQTISSIFQENVSDLPIASSASVVGHGMVVAVPLIRGKAAAKISFDSQFQSCTAVGTVSPGSITFKASDGKIYETTSAVRIGSASCTIQPGNPFAK
jgi:hypothetical protein